MIEIQVDERQMQHLRDLLTEIPRGLQKVLARAINRTVQRAKTRAIRGLAKGANVKQKWIRRAVRTYRASWEHLQGRVQIRSRRIPLIEFGARQTARGVTVRLPGWAEQIFAGKAAGPGAVAGRRGRSLLEHAFIALMPRGHRGVFMRQTKKRLPIVELFGPTPNAIAEAVPGLMADLVTDARKHLAREVDVQLDLLLQRRAASLAGVRGGRVLASRLTASLAQLRPAA